MGWHREHKRFVCLCNGRDKKHPSQNLRVSGEFRCSVCLLFGSIHQGTGETDRSVRQKEGKKMNGRGC